MQGQEDILFIGNFLYTLDNKDRINIPSRWRKELPPESGDSFVITKGFETCLYMYPANYWYHFIYRYRNTFASDQEEDRKFAIWCLRDANEVQMDKQGRIPVPKILLRYSRISKEVKIIGNRNRIELWNPDICDEFVGHDDGVYKKKAASFASGLSAMNQAAADSPGLYPPPYNPASMPVPNQQGYPQYPPVYPYYPPGYHPYYPYNYMPGQPPMLTGGYPEQPYKGPDKPPASQNPKPNTNQPPSQNSDQKSEDPEGQ